MSLTVDQTELVAADEILHVTIALTNRAGTPKAIAVSCPFLFYRLESPTGEESAGDADCARFGPEEGRAVRMAPGASHADTLRWDPSPRVPGMNDVVRWPPGVYRLVGVARLENSERATPGVDVELRCRQPEWQAC